MTRAKGIMYLPGEMEERYKASRERFFTDYLTLGVTLEHQWLTFVSSIVVHEIVSIRKPTRRSSSLQLLLSPIYDWIGRSSAFENNERNVSVHRVLTSISINRESKLAGRRFDRGQRALDTPDVLIKMRGRRTLCFSRVVQGEGERKKNGKKIIAALIWKYRNHVVKRADETLVGTKKGERGRKGKGGEWGDGRFMYSDVLRSMGKRRVTDTDRPPPVSFVFLLIKLARDPFATATASPPPPPPPHRPLTLRRSDHRLNFFSSPTIPKGLAIAFARWTN